MARYVDRSAQAKKEIRGKLIPAMARVGYAVEAVAKRKTRVDTGNARRSCHTVVVDESGNRVDGANTDENGNGTPVYPATGRLTTYVGYNCGYSVWLEIGARGRSGDAMLATGLAGVPGFARREMSGLLKGGPG